MNPVLPDCGVYLVWPTEGTEWIHPDDVEIATNWIPSDRVFRRTKYDGVFYQLEYGQVVLRVRPTMWLLVQDEGIRIGDQVEILSRFQVNEPGIGHIAEIRYDKAHAGIRYSVETREIVLPRSFEATDLRLLTHRTQLVESDYASPRPVPKELGQKDIGLENC